MLFDFRSLKPDIAKQIIGDVLKRADDPPHVVFTPQPLIGRPEEAEGAACFGKISLIGWPLRRHRQAKQPR